MLTLLWNLQTGLQIIIADSHKSICSPYNWEWVSGSSYLVLVASGTTPLAKLPHPWRDTSRGLVRKAVLPQMNPYPQGTASHPQASSQSIIGGPKEALWIGQISPWKQWKKNWYFNCQIRYILCGPVAPIQIRYFMIFFLSVISDYLCLFINPRLLDCGAGTKATLLVDTNLVPLCLWRI